MEPSHEASFAKIWLISPFKRVPSRKLKEALKMRGVLAHDPDDRLNKSAQYFLEILSDAFKKLAGFMK